jgi:(p)ppGpp synthase/HD superfamily hydrolase
MRFLSMLAFSAWLVVGGLWAGVSECRKYVQEHAEDHPNVMRMFDETVELWRDHYDLERLLAGVAVAAEMHEGQYRKDGEATPYIVHPIGVARSLWEEAGVRSTNVLVAALLHDTLDDTEMTAEQIERQFGARVRVTVEELTAEPGLSVEEAREKQIARAPQMTLNAQLIKLADKLYGLREMAANPPNWDKNAMRRHLQMARRLVDALRGANLQLEQAYRKELQQLESPKKG